MSGWFKSTLIEVFWFSEPSAVPEAEGRAEPEPAPKAKAKAKAGSQAWYVQLLPPKADLAISMNDMIRSIPPPRPPRRPGTQSRRFNGLWWHY